MRTAESPVLVNAAVGTGKTMMAGAIMIRLLYGNTAYMAKLLIAVPLVDLAVEQHATFATWADNLNTSLPARTRIAVALRAGKHRVGDIRRAAVVVATYEVARLMLADADAPIYPGSERLTRTWRAAWRAIVIDEAHSIMGDRGTVVSSVVALAKHYAIPLMMLTGTPHAQMVESLRAYFDRRLELIVSPPAARCQQVPIYVPDLNAFRAVLVNLYLTNVMPGELNANGCLVFARTIADVYLCFRNLVADLTAKVTAELARESVIPAGQLQILSRALVVDQTEPGADFDVSWSGSARDNRPPTEQVMSERKLARDMMQLGIAYYWRDIGPRYSRLIFLRLAQGRMRMLFSTSKLAAGVNIPGVRHVAVYNAPTSAAELAQMIGRAGRWCMGFVFLLGMTPPTEAHIVSTMPRPSASAPRELVFWWMLKKAYAPYLDQQRNLARWRWPLATWAAFLKAIPSPRLAPEKYAAECDAALDFLMETLKIVVVGDDGNVGLVVSENVLDVAEGNAEVIAAGIHVLELACPDDAPATNQGIPWVPALVYWASRIRSLPTLTWGNRRHDFAEALANAAGTNIMKETLGQLGQVMTGVLGGKSSLGRPFEQSDPWVLSNVVALTQITAFCLAGVLLDFTSYVARVSLASILPDLAKMSALLTECAQWVRTTPQQVTARVTYPGQVIGAACEIANAIAHPRDAPDVVLAAQTPLHLVAIRAQRMDARVGHALQALVQAHAIAQGFFATPETAFSPRWRAGLGTVMTVGVRQVRPERVVDDSD
jgi:hypothetical protein